LWGEGWVVPVPRGAKRLNCYHNDVVARTLNQSGRNVYGYHKITDSVLERDVS
jgi:hypothetical protein